MKEAIEVILKEMRPGIEGDGGKMEIIDISADGTVHLRQEEHCGS